MAANVVRFRATRDDLQRLLGQPDDVSVPPRRKRESMIWEYGKVEYPFGLDGRVFLIYTEDADGSGRVLAGKDDRSG